jgi:hypothetical protein
MDEFDAEYEYLKQCDDARLDDTTSLSSGFMHLYEVRPRKDKRGVDLISDALPFGRLWYDGPNAASNAIGYAGQYSRSHGAVIRVYDDAGYAGETHQHAVDFIAPIQVTG